MKITVLIAALCLAAGMAPADTRADAITSLTAVNDSFNTSAAASDADALTALYAQNTLGIAQGAPVRQGLEGPRQLFGFVISNEGKVTHTIDHLFVSEDASLAVMIGPVEAVVESVGMDATGTYLFALRPDDDGWKIVTDMWHQHVAQ